MWDSLCIKYIRFSFDFVMKNSCNFFAIIVTIDFSALLFQTTSVPRIEETMKTWLLNKVYLKYILTANMKTTKLFFNVLFTKFTNCKCNISHKRIFKNLNILLNYLNLINYDANYLTNNCINLKKLEIFSLFVILL